MKKTSKFTRIWDEENKQFVFERAEEAPVSNWCCVYGNFAQCEEADIEKTKLHLLDNMMDVIRELAKKDEFWIVKKVDDAYTVAWKAEFPQLLATRVSNVDESKDVPVLTLGEN